MGGPKPRRRYQEGMRQYAGIVAAMFKQQPGGVQAEDQQRHVSRNRHGSLLADTAPLALLLCPSLWCIQGPINLVVSHEASSPLVTTT
eukprot:365911-Chlamydomonas_euryale.AAC.8